MMTEIILEELQLYTGKVSHLVDRSAPRLPDVTVGRAPSLCAIQPMWPGYWTVPVEELPICGRCAAVKEANERAREA